MGTARTPRSWTLVRALFAVLFGHWHVRMGLGRGFTLFVMDLVQLERNSSADERVQNPALRG